MLMAIEHFYLFANWKIVHKKPLNTTFSLTLKHLKNSKWHFLRDK